MRKIAKNKRSIKTEKKALVVCPECHGQKAFLAGHNSSDSVDCYTCNGEGKVLAPKIKVEERDEVMLNGKRLVKGKDYSLIPGRGIVLNEKIASKIASAKNYNISCSYSKSMTTK